MMPIDFRRTCPTPPADLLGTWNILLSNFPMWLSGKKRAPTITYTALERPDQLGDQVRYQTRGGKVRQIRGVDTQDPLNPGHFTWRGSGLLSLLTSEWYVVYKDLDAGLLGIYFTATLFTPEGLDLLGRQSDPSKEAVAAALLALSELPGLETQTATLQRLEAPKEFDT